MPLLSLSLFAQHPASAHQGAVSLLSIFDFQSFEHVPRCSFLCTYLAWIEDRLLESAS